MTLEYFLPFTKFFVVVFQEAIGVLVPQQQARVQRLRQKRLCADASEDAALQLPDIAICTAGVNV